MHILAPHVWVQSVFDFNLLKFSSIKTKACFLINNGQADSRQCRFSKSLHIIFSFTRFAPVTLLFYLERKLLCDFRQVRNSSFGLMERNNYKILKEFPLLQFHQIPLQGPVPPRLSQHGLDRHKPLAMSCGTQKHISSTCMYAIHRYIHNVCVSCSEPTNYSLHFQL